MDIRYLLQLAVDRKASDLHVLAGILPVLRIDGVLTLIPNEAVVTPTEMEKAVKEVLASEQQAKYLANRELDFSYAFSEKARFRVNAYTQKGTQALAFRRIPMEVPGIDSLGLPKIIHSFTTLRQGLILVTGPTGHGKSTTLAAVLNEINSTRSEHIVTVEDPIEFVLKPVKSIISQREMGYDTNSWSIALRSILREDPNVVLIGEMRDYETMASAITIAETGHLVFATLHTNSAAQTIDRIVDVFPEEQQTQIRLQLSNVIEGVFSMRLVPATAGGRAVAYEVMLGSDAIRNIIREGKTHQINNVIQTSSELGMSTLEASLVSLVKEGKVAMDVAISYSIHPEEITRMVRK